MAVKIENENDHENEHDGRGQTLAKFCSLLRGISVAGDSSPSTKRFHSLRFSALARNISP
jgi:hypothetical protein